MNNMKIIGAVLIILTSWLTGIMLSKRLSQREELLIELKQLLSEIKRRITYEMPTMCDLISNCGTQYLKPFTDNMYNSLSGGYTINESVISAVADTPLLCVLQDCEKQLITDVLSSLGAADSTSVREITDSTIIQLDHYIGLAQENRQKNSKVYFVTSLYIGFAAVILMI